MLLYLRVLADRGYLGICTYGQLLIFDANIIRMGDVADADDVLRLYDPVLHLDEQVCTAG